MVDKIGAKIFRTRQRTVKANSWVMAKGRLCFIVDTNDETLSLLEAEGLEPIMIFVTHEHYDHIEDLNSIRERYKKARVIASLEASRLIVDPKKNLSVFSDGKGFFAKPPDIVVENDAVFDVLGTEVRCKVLKGHSEGGMIIYLPGMLFSGDTLLPDQRTPTKLPGGDRGELEKSLKFIDINFNGETVIYPGHGENFLKKNWNKYISLDGLKK